MIERELKAVVPDVRAVRDALARAAAVRTFAGTMTDRRYDRDGALAARDEVLRVRRYQGDDGSVRAKVAWKGPVSIADGYKLRPEHEIETPDGEAASRLLEALGYSPVHAVDRYVEYYQVAEAVVRLEWYPRMDILIEVEGSAPAIERAVAATGLDRERFSADALAVFVTRYQARVGGPAAVALAELGASEMPSWEAGR